MNQTVSVGIDMLCPACGCGTWQQNIICWIIMLSLMGLILYLVGKYGVDEK